MKTGIYITNTESYTGRSLVALGVFKLLLTKVGKVGFFRPIINDQPQGKHDKHIDTMLKYFDLDQDYKDAYGFTMSQVVKYINMGQEARLIERIIDKYKALEKRFDFVVVEGADLSENGIPVGFDLDIEIAKNLALPTILVSLGKGKVMQAAISNIDLAIKSCAEQDVKVQSVFMNCVAPEKMEPMKKELKAVVGEDINVEVIPEIKELSNLILREIQEAIDGKILLGEKLLDKQVKRVEIGAMHLRNFLERLEEDTLIITPGDRSDIIMSAINANASTNYPTISGILVTGDIEPQGAIMKLFEGLESTVPIILVKGSTFEAANQVARIKPQISPELTRKIELSITTFEEHVDSEFLVDRFRNYHTDVVTPHMFQYSMVAKAKAQKKHIVMPEGTDKRILTAAISLVEQNVVDITLLGKPEEVNAKALEIGLKLPESINVIDPLKSEYYEDYWQTYYELRKHKGIPHDMARDTMADVSYFGTMMVYKGHADGMVSGAVHTTAHTIVPALQFVKTRPGVSTVSSCFFMCLEDHVAVFGDCAVNVSPNSDQLAEIAISSAESAKEFGIEPKVAMLSYSSGTSGTGAEVDKVREATEKAKALRPDLKIEGPIQYDAAVDPVVGKSKMPGSEVAGQATVLVFPDLNTGNNTYKAVQRETGALAIGPMLQGLNKPVNDLSRGCTIDDIFNTVVITAIQAQD